jgi:putative endonuclease
MAKTDLTKTGLPKTDMAKTDRALPDPAVKAASPERVAAFRAGLSAESRAAAYLMAKGYRILAKRFRTPHGGAICWPLSRSKPGRAWTRRHSQ